jgi:DNA-binding XRE family transcriptional regulator
LNVDKRGWDARAIICGGEGKESAVTSWWIANTQYAGWKEGCVPVLVTGRASAASPDCSREGIRAYCKKAGLTQEDLAERADLHHNFVGEVERGNMECSLTSMVKIAKALRVRVFDLGRKV